MAVYIMNTAFIKSRNSSHISTTGRFPFFPGSNYRLFCIGIMPQFLVILLQRCPFRYILHCNLTFIDFSAARILSGNSSHAYNVVGVTGSPYCSCKTAVYNFIIILSGNSSKASVRAFVTINNRNTFHITNRARIDSSRTSKPSCLGFVTTTYLGIDCRFVQVCINPDTINTPLVFSSDSSDPAIHGSRYYLHIITIIVPCLKITGIVVLLCFSNCSAGFIQACYSAQPGRICAIRRIFYNGLFYHTVGYLACILSCNTSRIGPSCNRCNIFLRFYSATAYH